MDDDAGAAECSERTTSENASPTEPGVGGVLSAVIDSVASSSLCTSIEILFNKN